MTENGRSDSDRLAVLEERLDLLHGMVFDLIGLTENHQKAIHTILRTMEALQKSLSILSQVPQV
jgi:hypothetical protein